MRGVVQELSQFSNGAKELFMKDEEGDGTVSLMPSLKFAVQKKPEKKVRRAGRQSVGTTDE